MNFVVLYLLLLWTCIVQLAKFGWVFVYMQGHLYQVKSLHIKKYFILDVQLGFKYASRMSYISFGFQNES